MPMDAKALPAPFLEKPSDPPPVPWSDWISLFDRYLTEERCPEEDKAQRLLLCLGDEGRRILRSLPGPTGTYTEMVSALTAHYDDMARRKEKRNILITAAAVGGALVGGVGAVVAAPFVLAGIGFTSAGIAAGSVAASMMSSAAIANGGAVAAGSLVAILQSAGAVGLTAGASAVVAGAGAAVGGAAAGAVGALSSTSSKETEPKQDPNDGKNGSK
ncbi:uncharacterized protein LOC139926559 [Centroberyx gerrardi]